jgi:hypothetical protein
MADNPYDGDPIPSFSGETEKPDNPYDREPVPFFTQFGKPEETSSTFGAGFRVLERGILPAAGGLIAGAAAGSALAGPFGTAAGAIIGGLGGGFAGSYGAEVAQDYALSKAPESWQDALGGTEEQQRLDREQHPYASFIGGLLPFAVTMKLGGFAKPANYDSLTNFQKLIAHPVASRLFGGSVVGGVEMSQELLSGQKPDWADVATATAFGMVFNKPNRLGEKIEGYGTSLAARFGAHDPTIADAQDLGQFGIGQPESVALNEEQANPQARASNQVPKQAEMILQGKSPVYSDIENETRILYPELFADRNATAAQDKALGDKIAELSAPEAPAILGKTFEQSSENAVAALKEKWTLVNGELQKKNEAINAALQKVAEKRGVDLNNISDQENQQVVFNYFKNEALKDAVRSGAKIDPGAIDAWATTMASAYMTESQRMGFYQPHGIAFGQGQGRTLQQSPGFLPGFYSGAEHAIITSKQERASGDQWLGQLRNSPTVKPDEIKALGLEEWLKGQGKVSRSDLLDYVRANSLQIEEVQKSGIPAVRPPLHGAFGALQEALMGGGDFDPAHIEQLGAFQEAVRAEEGFNPAHTEYGHVVLPGTDPQSYHEVLLTLPSREPAFQNSHWGEPNVVAHVRFDTREVDGKKTLVIQELQSDWHQEGSKKGYIDLGVWRQRKGEYERADAAVNKAIEDTLKFRNERGKELERAFTARRAGNETPEQTQLVDEYHALGDAHDNAYNDFVLAKDAFEHIRYTSVPDAPFKTSWPELILKRMLRYAAENGIEKVSWPGDASTVAKVEGWPEPQLVNGKWILDHGGGHKSDVTPIIERYTKDLPRLAEKLGKKFGVKVEGEAEDELKFNSLTLPPDFQSSILEKGFPLYQGGAQPLARVTITPDGSQKLLELFKRANESSLFHESGHIFLEQLAKDAAHPQAPQQIKDDFKTVLDVLGAKDHASITTEQHERFARSFEQYLLDGKAPSQGLARVFEMMREWLTKIYGAFVRQGEKFPEELRGVMDRLLATDKEIQQYRSSAPPTLSDVHHELARSAAPDESLPLAAKISAERLAAQPPREVANEIAQAQNDLSGAAGDGSEGLRELDADRNQAGNEPGGEHMGTGGSKKRAGGNEPAAKGGAEQGGSKSNPIAPTATRTYPRGAGSRFVDANGNFSLRDVKNFEDLKQLMADMKEGDNVADGPATPGMILDLANAMGLNGLTNKVGLNAKEIAKAQAILGQASLDVVNARKALAESPSYIRQDSPEFGDVAKSALEYEKTLQRMKFVMGVYADARREWGRAGHALQALYKQWSAEEIKNIEALTGRSFNQLMAEAKLGVGMDDLFKNAKWVRDQRKPTLGRMLVELFTNNILSGVATHVTYALSNTTLSMQKTFLDIPTASLIGAIRQHFDPTREKIYSSEAVARAMELYRSVPKGIQAGLEGLRTGQQIRSSEAEIRPTQAWRKLTRAEMKSPPPGQYLTQEDLAKAIAQHDVSWHEAGASFFGMMRGIRDAFISHGNVLAAGGTPKFSISPTRSQLGYIPGFDIQAGSLSFNAPVGNILRLPTRAVAGLHSLQYTMNYSTEINAWAWRQAIKEGYAPYSEAHTARTGELRQNPSPAAMQNASTNAYNLSLLGEGRELTRRLNSVFNYAPNLPFLGETPIFKFIDPFIRITTNIFHQNILERTPIGLLAPSIRRELLGEHFRPEDTPEQRGLKQIDQDVAQARMIVGSLMSVFFGGLAYEGYLIGAGPTDPRKRAIWEVNGYKSHSIRIGDINYSIARLGSFGMLASTVADLYQVAHIASTEDMNHASLHLAHAFVQNMIDESFFRGIADLAQAIEDPTRHGEEWVQNFVPAFIPYSSFLNQANHAIDPYTRNARTVVDSIMAKLPWESQQLTPRRDVWGEPVKNPDALIGKGITAIYEYQISRDPVNVALKQLDVGIPQVPRTIRNVKLTDQEYDDFQKYSGRLLKQRLTALVTSGYWNQLDPNTKRQTVQEFVSQSRNVAREIMLGKYHHIIADATRLRAHRFDDEED